MSTQTAVRLQHQVHATPAMSSTPSQAQLHQLPQPVASSSRNPQLSNDPYFAYPTPTPEQIEAELPPYKEGDNIALGMLLDRLVHKSYGDLRNLVEQTLPPLAPRQKPKPIIEYAKTTRQTILKYIAVMRWKTSVDLGAGTGAIGAPSQTQGATVSFPTPHSNGDSNDTSPPVKGKGRFDGTEDTGNRGKVTDARRIQELLEHQGAQYMEGVKHLRHVTKSIDMLRERNADLLTALVVQSSGTYTRLPTDLTDSFVPRPPLNPPLILDTVRRLNEHLLYRIRCVDYLPPEIVVERVENGRVYVSGGGENGWKAQLSVVGFEDDSRWWLTGVEWAWAAKDSKSSAKAFGQEERVQILELANNEILVPRKPPETDDGEDGLSRKVDAPLVRIYNFLQHLSLSYQLEVLASQAIAMAQGRWRGQLLLDMDRSAKELKVRYWVRSRTESKTAQQSGAKRSQPPSSLGTSRQPLIGGTLTFSLTESSVPMEEAERFLCEVAACGMIPSDRTVRLGITIKWDAGEAGVGGGLKAGDDMDVSILNIDPAALSMKEIVTTATRAHASQLARAILVPILSTPRLALDPENLPHLAETQDSTRPLTLIVPLPLKQPRSYLAVGVSATTGLIEIEDSSANNFGQLLENGRSIRAKLATASVNEHKARLADDLYRLISAVLLEEVEDNLHQLGLHPVRRVALRTHDLAKTDLHPMSTVFVPLPVSPAHYFVAKVTPEGLMYELLKLLRVPMENGAGLKLSVGDRTPIQLEKLVERRRTRARKRPLETEDNDGDDPKWDVTIGHSTQYPFRVHLKDLRDMYYYCNALVAQTIVEQQLKDRGIPYTAHFPVDTDFPVQRSRSALAGMVPNLCVNATDLFKDDRASDVSSPKVFLVINDWWKGDKCTVETIVRLRHRPSATDAATPGPASSTAARAEGITFDPATSTVRFRAPNIARCLPDFLEQWERISKVIVVAGEINRLNKLGEQDRDIRMLAFDLCTATLQYAPGYQVAITYTPTSDSYEASFFRAAANSSTPAFGTPAVEGEPSPHQLIAPLLSHKLNELTAQPTDAKDYLGSVGLQFVQLLRATLPVLLEAEALRVSSASEFPSLVIKSVTEYRLVWDASGVTRYALDVNLTADGTQFLITDASRSRPGIPADLTCGRLTAIPGLDKAISKGFQAARAAKVLTPGSMGTVGTPFTPAAAMTPVAPKTPATAATPSRAGNGATTGGAARTINASAPPAVRLDGGASILCNVQIVQDVLRAMATEIETAIGTASK